MKRVNVVSCWLAVAMLFGSATGFAAEGTSRKAGIGIIFGEPTGLTYKQWESSAKSFDVGLAYSLSNFLLLYGDHLWHFPRWLRGTELAKDSGLRWMPYLGVGGVFVISTNTTRTDKGLFLDSGSSVGLGVRVPVGLEWLPRDPSLGVFVEIVPGIALIPGIEGFFQGGLGIRYYFK